MSASVIGADVECDSVLFSTLCDVELYFESDEFRKLEVVDVIGGVVVVVVVVVVVEVVEVEEVLEVVEVFAVFKLFKVFKVFELFDVFEILEVLEVPLLLVVVPAGVVVILSDGVELGAEVDVVVDVDVLVGFSKGLN